MRKLGYRAGLFTAGAALAVGSSPAMAARFQPAAICSGTVPDRHPAATITVRGNRVSFTEAGNVSQGVIRGFNFRALVTDHRRAFDQANSLADDANFYRQIYQADLRYGVAEITAMKRWGANTARFQVSQHDMEINDPAYVQCLTNAVRMARNNGLLVILAMQWQKNLTGDAYGRKLPTIATARAWKHVDAIFHDDPGIMYDVYNEPAPDLYSDRDKRKLSGRAGKLWREWLFGDRNGDKGYIGHQRLITWMRSAQGLGTHKVLLVEPLGLGLSYEGLPLLNGLPPIRDPEHRLVYAVHPYLKGRLASTSAEQYAVYDRRWGYLKKLGVPVMVTEWSQKGRTLHGAPAVRAADLVNYVNHNDIPLIVSAFDVNGMFVKGLNLTPNPQPRRPTNFDRYAPPGHTSGSGPGILICRFFRRGYEPSFSFTEAYLKSPPIRDAAGNVVQADNPPVCGAGSKGSGPRE